MTASFTEQMANSYPLIGILSSEKWCNLRRDPLCLASLGLGLHRQGYSEGDYSREA